LRSIAALANPVEFVQCAQARRCCNSTVGEWGAYLPGSELGGLLDISPTLVDPRIIPVEAHGPDEEDFLRVRPNKGIHVIFFFDGPALS
jgi:hypothetical protein